MERKEGSGRVHPAPLISKDIAKLSYFFTARTKLNEETDKVAGRKKGPAPLEWFGKDKEGNA